MMPIFWPTAALRWPLAGNCCTRAPQAGILFTTLVGTNEADSRSSAKNGRLQRKDHQIRAVFRQVSIVFLVFSTSTMLNERLLDVTLSVISATATDYSRGLCSPAHLDQHLLVVIEKHPRNYHQVFQLSPKTLYRQQLIV